MPAQNSPSDKKFAQRFEAGEVAPADFHHRDHLRLVYVYLCESDLAGATDRMRQELKTFLSRNKVPPEKFHETLTVSWVQAVQHFRNKYPDAKSFDSFLDYDARLLDVDIMQTHYSKATLFSDQARTAFVAPDIDPIPLSVS